MWTEQQQDVEKGKTKETKDAIKGSTEKRNDVQFYVFYILAQLCGVAMIVLVAIWVDQYFGGYEWTSNPVIQFNWHPLFMTIGFIFLYGNSILIYRVLRSCKKIILKLTHAGIFLVGFVLTIIALITAFDSHNLRNPPIPNMYSLHSWLGMAAIIVFCLQYIIGFLAFLLPIMPVSWKAALMPLHIIFGLFGFVLAISCGLTGITEKAIFSIRDYSQLPTAGVLANCIGLLYVIFGGLIVYLAAETSFKRKPNLKIDESNNIIKHF